MSVQLKDLIHHVIDGVHEDLFQLVTRTLPTLPFEQRRTSLSAYIHRARRHLCQLLILVEWRHTHAHAYDTIQDTAAFAENQQKELTLLLDKFFWMHDGLFRKRVASGPYDVASAIDVLGYGAFPRLPREVQLGKTSTRGDFTLKEETHRKRQSCVGSIPKMEHAIRSRLVIQDPPPQALSVIEVGAGLLRLSEPHHFSLTLCLSDVDPVTATWRPLHLRLLLHDAVPQQAPRLPPLTLKQQQQLYRMLTNRLEEDPSPLSSVYKACHSLCVELQLLTLAGQAHALAQGDWCSELSVKQHEDAHVVDLGLWGHEASSRTDSLWRTYLSRLEQEEEAEGGEGGQEAAEVVWEVNDPPLPARCAYLRLRVQRHDGLATMHASLGVGSDGERSSKFPCLDLAFDPSTLSIQDLLYKATSVLLPWKMDLLHSALSTLSPHWPLPLLMSREPHGLCLSLFETKVHVTLTVKTGAYVVNSNMSSASFSLALGELQKALDFVDLGEELLKAPLLEVLRSIIVDQVSRTGMALKLYPNRRWAQLLPLLNAHTQQQGQASRIQLALQLPSPSAPPSGDPSLSGVGEKAVLGVGVGDDMGMECSLLLACGDGATLPKVQAHVALRPILQDLQERGVLSRPVGDTATQLLPYQRELGEAASLAISLIEMQRFLSAATDVSSEGFSSFPPSALASLAAHSPVSVPWSSRFSVTDVTVRCLPSAAHGWLTWCWSLTHPSLPPSLPAPQSFLSHSPSLPSLTLLSIGPQRMELTFSPGWPPKAMYQAVANACLAISDLSALHATVVSAAPSLCLTPPPSPCFFEVPLHPTDPQAQPLSLRHVGLCPVEAHRQQHTQHCPTLPTALAVRPTLAEGGPFYLHFTGELEDTSGSALWGMVEGVFNTSRSLPTLLTHVAALSPLATLARRAGRRHWGQSPRLVPWAVNALAVSPPEDTENRALVLRVEGGGGVVLTRVDEKSALRGRRLDRAELSEELMIREFGEWFD